LSKIQRTIRERRAHRRWFAPALALGSAVVLAGAGIGAYALVNGNGGNDTVEIGESPTPTPSASPSPTEVPASDFPALAIFPFTTADQAQTWEGQYDEGHMPWVADPEAVAQTWVANILEQPSVDKVISKKLATNVASVTLGRVIGGEAKKPVPITTVQLEKFGRAWIVVGADDPADNLKLTAPDAGDKVTSPLTVTGPGFGVDETVQVEVRAADQPTSYGSGRTGFGNGTDQWEVPVDFSAPTGGIGVVAAVVGSAADGGPQRIAVEQVRFGQQAHAAGPPKFFYGVTDGRVAKFDSSDGSRVEYLTDQQPGGGPSDPQLSSSGELVYVLQGSGTCSNTLVSVAVGGNHDVSPVASPDDGYVIAGYDVLNPAPAAQGSASDAVAFYEEACDPGRTSPQAKLVMRTWDGARKVVPFKAEPPTIEGDPSWTPDGTAVIAFVRTGNMGHLARYDATSGEEQNACSTSDQLAGMPRAVDVDAQGRIWVALQTGAANLSPIATCTQAGWQEQFDIPTDVPADVSVAGSAALATSSDGKVWRWDGGGAVLQLSPGTKLPQVAW
jgi:hypothetical protein